MGQGLRAPGGRATGRAGGCASRRGMTLLEVILAVLLLGLVTASITSAMTFVHSMQARSVQRLGAYELANRLILLFLDDDRTVNQIRGRPLDYGKYRYRWELTSDRFEMKIKTPEAGSSRPRPQYLDRFVLVDVRVWLADDRPGSNDRPGEMMAELTRLIDPVAARNPDAARRLVAPDRMQKIFEIISGSAPPAPGGSSNRPGSGTSGGGRR